eukprot:CAMPEP_0117653924 /NCGR_PEP_ID=MMETSP0804-20121206/3461_1 /TAXON_ID=1074897 /ORGANISM="Tetraselmis astigmatica, Strain CCMP880" /LENGTH=722 /DNA_ID=CAMNT_0005460153 /DNA_START=175 /DNA_END=2343 /DNA_ORIENTATION=-
MQLKISNCPSQDLALTNCVYVSPSDSARLGSYIEFGSHVFYVQVDQRVDPGCVGLNAIQRRGTRVSAGDVVEVDSFQPPKGGFDAVVLTLEVGFVRNKGDKQEQVDAKVLANQMTRQYINQVFSQGQTLAVEYRGTNLVLTVNSLTTLDTVAAGGSVSASRAKLVKATTFLFEVVGGHSIKITNQRAVVTNQIFKSKELSFEKLGIGGLDSQFDDIFRRAFASRVFPPDVVEKLGISHVKGMLLYGPPGTGKTLIARQIGKMLNGKEPKVVNGPEILNKYVGQSEENMRNLFADAEAEYKARGEDSDLHIIIFDEIDAICKQRGSVSSASGVHDTLVNQLLTKIDGVDSLNNILLIGMTNRKDMLDEALLRPGRLEVHIEIGLPDEKGRQQIFKIHTSKMSVNSFLGRDVDLLDLAARTKNFSGAEIEGLVKSAVSFALHRQVNFGDLSTPIDHDALKVSMADFNAALEEVNPAFGSDLCSLESYRLHGMIFYSSAFEYLHRTCMTLVHQCANSDKTPLISCLLDGPMGSGTSALAATIAIESDFPFVKVISSDNMVGYSEAAKCQKISKVFDDAYKSPLSIIVLDDLERLLEYVPIGQRFSNAVLQTLLVLVKRMPPTGRKLMIVGTTSNGETLSMMDLSQAFNVCFNVPALREPDIKAVLIEVGAFDASEVDEAVSFLLDSEVPMKRLLLLLEMARQDQTSGQRIPMERWRTCLTDLNML